MLFQSIRSFFLKKVVKILQPSAFSYQVKNLKTYFHQVRYFYNFSRIPVRPSIWYVNLSRIPDFFQMPKRFFPNSEPILFFHTAKIFFKTVYGLLIWEILKLDLPVCHGSRQDFIWFEENFTLLLHSIYFVEILEIKPWKSAVCAGTASLQDSFERRKLSFLLVYTFFFSWPPDEKADA